MLSGFFTDYGFLVMLITGFFGLIITYRGREFSWPAFAVVAAVDFGAIHFMELDRSISIFDWNLLTGWIFVISLLGQVFMWVWFRTHPPKCQVCGNDLRKRKHFPLLR